MLSWGSNGCGQLGLGEEIEWQEQPALVAGLVGVAVSQVSAGAAHTMFLTLPGLVYGCGANQCGQLGLNRVDEKGSDSRRFHHTSQRAGSRPPLAEAIDELTPLRRVFNGHLKQEGSACVRSPPSGLWVCVSSAVERLTPLR